MQIFVTGMHRSGTSMVCRLVNLMGAYFGPEGCQHAPNEENPPGFWERKDFRALNDDILQAAGCTWDRVPEWDLDRLPKKTLEPLRRRAGELLFQLEGFRPWVTKEPRFCLTYPLYRDGCQAPLVVFVLRHPGEVAASLRARDGMKRPDAMALWKTYVQSALDCTADGPRIIIRHEDLVAEPARTTKSLFYQLYRRGVRGLHLPAARQIEAFVQPGLHRARKRGGKLPADVQALYDGLTATA